jgi:hypothetical protein
MMSEKASELNLSLRVGVGEDTQERHLGTVGLSTRVGDLMPDGSVKWEPWRKSHSFVKQFAQWIYACWSASTIATVLDVGGVARSVAAAGMRINASTGIATYGIAVGTSATAPTPSDYNLNAKISHGVTGGTLQYSTQITGVTNVGASVDLVLTRMFTNGSGALVTIEELGLLGYNGSYYFLLAHDLLTVAVANGATKVIEYKLSTTTGFAQQFLEVIESIFKQSSKTVRDTAGNAVTPAYSSATQMSMMGLTADSNYGLVVGSGVEPPSMSDYQLDQKIPSGSLAGQLYYNTSMINEPFVSGNNIEMALGRTFTNLSQATVTIREIGLIGYTATYYLLISHHLMTITVNPGITAFVEYRFRVTTV